MASGLRKVLSLSAGHTVAAMAHTYRQPGLVLTDHVIPVPLDHSRPDSATIEVFAREVVGSENLDRSGSPRDDLPWLVFLQGGPGGKANRPTGRSSIGWLDRALKDFRVVLLDQRGTGRSTPANRQTLAALGSPAAQADYLSHFRADSIVCDAELVRIALAGAGTTWSVLGQSYGGFCTTTYLSFAPDGLHEVFVTGGLPPLTATAEEVYRATYRRVLDKNALYFDRYPDDQEIGGRVAAYLAEHDVRLPTGERLTPRRFQMLGLWFGMGSHFDELHFLLEEAFVPGPAGPVLSDTFLYGAAAALSFADRPLYAVMHEPSYAQGKVTTWAAEQVRSEFPELAPDATPFLFTGEMIYPWLFGEDPALTPLRDVATILATEYEWPPVYDIERLRNNQVPVAAAIYHDDMYVEYAFSLETAKTVGNCRYWVTNEYEHDGLRVGDVLHRLIALARGSR
jgi:pimeloyl-ACP methyl ester carboxylesterase